MNPKKDAEAGVGILANITERIEESSKNILLYLFKKINGS